MNPSESQYLSVEAMSDEALLAELIRRRRDVLHDDDTTERATEQWIVVKLEEAALWICEKRARHHIGEDALLDWLIEVI